MRFDATFDTAIHVDCAHVQLMVHASDELVGVVAGSADEALRLAETLPHGLQPKTVDTYRSEWRQYLALARRLVGTSGLPGKDVPWNPYVLWRYMLMRSETCKPTTVNGCISALAHFGHRHRFVLPSTKWDGDPLLRRDILNMKREISILHKTNGGADRYDADHSTPLEGRSVGLILSALQVFDEKSFNALTRKHRHHLAITPMQHTKGMRFGHFIARRYTTKSFTRNVEGCSRLYTD